jgi:hypothetical protein
MLLTLMMIQRDPLFDENTKKPAWVMSLASTRYTMLHLADDVINTRNWYR